MNKANEKAFEKYPVSIDETWKDRNKRPRTAYIEGYYQVEKDNELTWKDIKLITDIVDSENLKPHLFDEIDYQEVLKRFKERK